MVFMNERRRREVIILGGATGLGRLLAGRLHRYFNVVTVDQLPFHDRPRDIEHISIQMTSKRSREQLFKRKPYAVIHTGFQELSHGRRAQFLDRKSITHLIQWITNVKPKKVIYVSSAVLYGATVETVGYIDESYPLTASALTSATGLAANADLIWQTLFWRAPKTQTTILRPVSLVGPYQNDWLRRLLGRRHVLGCMGFDPLLQLLHTDDFYPLIAQILETKISGIYNVAGSGVIPLTRLLEARGSRPLWIPEPLLERALRMRNIVTHAGDAHMIKRFLKYDLLVSDDSLRQAHNWQPYRRIVDTATSF